MRRIAVLGAGVVGSVYAALLASAGADVTMVARGDRLRQLRLRGLQVVLDEKRLMSEVRCASTLGEVADCDALLVCVRGDQLETVVPEIAAMGVRTVLVFTNALGLRAEVERRVGRDRVVWCFAGVGGALSDGTVQAHRVPQQPTVVETGARGSARAERILSAVDPRLRREPHMGPWLDTHSVFVAAMAGVILTRPLATRRQRWSAAARLTASMREAFAALHERGTHVTPANLRAIFMTVPSPLSTAYWAVQLGRPVVTVSMAPHARATRHSEQRHVARYALALVGESAPDYRELVEPLA